MASDSIYREDAKDYARHAMTKGLNVLEYLDEAPAANFRPVVRGRWVTRPYMMGQTEYRSRCGENYGRKYNFCPNCGADMREKS